MRRRINPEVALEVASTLQDWMPLSDTRALRWATDLLEQRADPDERADITARRINEAARTSARAQRDVRYHDVFSALSSLIRREIEARQQAKQDFARKALPSVTDGARLGRISVGIYGDIAAKRLAYGDFEQEFETRRRMTDDEIAARRADLAGERGAA